MADFWKCKHGHPGGSKTKTKKEKEDPGNSGIFGLVVHQNPGNAGRCFTKISGNPSLRNAVPMVKAPCWAMGPPDQIGKEAPACSKFLGRKKKEIREKL